MTNFFLRYLPRLALPRLLAGLLVLPACAQPKPSAHSPAMPAYQTETFYLSAGPCAAKGYPMTIHFGAFVRSDGRTFPVPSGHYLRGSWGVASRAWVVGDENQPAPASLELIYFSYTEDKFYEGRFDLPQQHLHELLKTGFWNTDKKQHATYDELVVCALPKGAVVLWLSGIGKEVLVGRFQASESPADFKRFYPQTDRAAMFKEERAQFLPAVQQQIAEHTISAGQWDRYLTKYAWQVAFSQPLQLTFYRINYLSAEYTAFPDTHELAPYLQAILAPSYQAVPASLSLYVRDEAGHSYQLRAKAFDEAETMAAFRTLHNETPGHPLTLRVETDKYVKKATLVLTNGLRTIPLTKTIVEVLTQD